MPLESSLTVHEAAATTGWSARMLRYLERVGLVVPARTPSGYRNYRAEEVQRLRTLRELLANHDIALSDVAFAKRLRDDQKLSESIEDWLEAKPEKPTTVAPADWLSWEQEKCRRLLAAAAAACGSDRPLPSPANQEQGELSRV